MVTIIIIKRIIQPQTLSTHAVNFLIETLLKSNVNRVFFIFYRDLNLLHFFNFLFQKFNGTFNKNPKLASSTNLQFSKCFNF